MKWIYLPAALLWCISFRTADSWLFCVFCVPEARLSSADNQLRRGMRHFRCLSASLVAYITHFDTLMLIFDMTDKRLIYRYTRKSYNDVQLQTFCTLWHTDAQCVKIQLRSYRSTAVLYVLRMSALTICFSPGFPELNVVARVEEQGSLYHGTLPDSVVLLMDRV